MKLFKKNSINKSNKEIKKSKEIIKKEKQRIKEEKKKQKKLKQEKFYQTKLGKIIKKIFLIKENNTDTPPSITIQIISIIYFQITGAIICLLVLYALTGGKNYFKLYIELNKLIDTYDTITKEYYGKIDKEQLVDNATKTMIDTADDAYTNYNNEEETNSFMENVSGTYEGIGATVSMDENDNIIVISIFEDSPAAKAGLKEKDIIIKVDDKDYTEKTSTDVANYVKSSTKNKIKLTILRDNKEQ